MTTSQVSKVAVVEQFEKRSDGFYYGSGKTLNGGTMSFGPSLLYDYRGSNPYVGTMWNVFNHPDGEMYDKTKPTYWFPGYDAAEWSSGKTSKLLYNLEQTPTSATSTDVWQTLANFSNLPSAPESWCVHVDPCTAAAGVRCCNIPEVLSGTSQPLDETVEQGRRRDFSTATMNVEKTDDSNPTATQNPSVVTYEKRADGLYYGTMLFGGEQKPFGPAWRLEVKGTIEHSVFSGMPVSNPRGSNYDPSKESYVFVVGESPQSWNDDMMKKMYRLSQGTTGDAVVPPGWCLQIDPCVGACCNSQANAGKKYMVALAVILALSLCVGGIVRVLK